MKLTLTALLALCCPVAVWAAPAKVPAKPVAKLQIDARGVAALDKAVALYRSQPSFSVSARFTATINGKRSPDVRSDLSLQLPQRAFLRSIAADGSRKPLTLRFLNNALVIHSNLSGHASSANLKSMDEAGRSRVLQTFFEESAHYGISPLLKHSIVPLASGVNPARGVAVESVTYRELSLAGGDVEIVSLTLKTSYETTLLEYQLSTETHALRKATMRRRFLDEQGLFIMELDAPVFNWKGSQLATDAAVYNWDKLAPDTELESERPATKVVVDPKARAIFARATKLYGAAKTLRIRWKSRNESGELATNSLDFDRAGRLRLAGAELIQPLVVVDGKNRWSLDDIYDADKGSIRIYSRAEAELNEVHFEMQTAPGIAGVLGMLIGEVNPLEADVVSTESESLELSEFRAVLLPPQSLNGQACDIVRIACVQALNPEVVEDEIQKVTQQTYWFSRENGALMRFENRLMGSGTKLNPSDWQITEQTFNPKFAPDTFKFTPPKGAVLAK